MTAPPVLRFAPSPNGELHLGHAFSAWVAWTMARRLSGRFLLRIEDIDRERCRPEFEQGIYRDLEWLGLEWERPVRRQSEHFAEYAGAIGRLERMGLLYPCFASRREIQEAVAAGPQPSPADPDGAPLYPGLWRGADPAEVERRRRRGDPFALRLDMDKALALLGDTAPLAFTEIDEDGRQIAVTPAQPAQWGDVVLARKETPASYHLCVVVDDALQGITHVTRGLDLHAATHIHRLLQHLLGLSAPLYHHHALVSGADGRKLSKSAGDTGLASLRAAGATPQAVIALARAGITGVSAKS